MTGFRLSSPLARSLFLGLWLSSTCTSGGLTPSHVMLCPSLQRSFSLSFPLCFLLLLGEGGGIMVEEEDDEEEMVRAGRLELAGGSMPEP